MEFEKNIFAPKRLNIKPFDYETLLKREEDGNEFITAYDAEGEEIQVSIKYLLDGVGNCVVEKEQTSTQGIQLKQSGLVDKNLKQQIDLLLEREKLGSKKASLDAVSRTIWILFLAALFGLIIWRFPKVEDWSKPDLWTIIAGILAFVAVVPSLIKFIGNLVFHGDEEKKKKFSQYLYSLPLRLIKKIAYALGGFTESDYVDICNQLTDKEQKGQKPFLPSS